MAFYIRNCFHFSLRLKSAMRKNCTFVVQIENFFGRFHFLFIPNRKKSDFFLYLDWRIFWHSREKLKWEKLWIKINCFSSFRLIEWKPWIQKLLFSSMLLITIIPFDLRFNAFYRDYFRYWFIAWGVEWVGCVGDSIRNCKYLNDFIKASN
jgi:hypothetical protein